MVEAQKNIMFHCERQALSVNKRYVCEAITTNGRKNGLSYTMLLRVIGQPLYYALALSLDKVIYRHAQQNRQH